MKNIKSTGMLAVLLAAVMTMSWPAHAEEVEMPAAEEMGTLQSLWQAAVDATDEFTAYASSVFTWGDDALEANAIVEGMPEAEDFHHDTPSTVPATYDSPPTEGDVSIECADAIKLCADTLDDTKCGLASSICELYPSAVEVMDDEVKTKGLALQTFNR